MKAIAAEPALFAIGCAFALLAIGCAIMNWKTVIRLHYQQRFGYRASSLWMLPTLAFGFIAWACFNSVFRK